MQCTEEMEGLLTAGKNPKKRIALENEVALQQWDSQWSAKPKIQ